MKHFLRFFFLLIVCSLVLQSCGFSDNGKIEGMYEYFSNGEREVFIIRPSEISHYALDSNGYKINGKHGDCWTVPRSLVNVQGNTWFFTPPFEKYTYGLDISKHGFVIFYQDNGFKEVYSKCSNDYDYY